MNLTTKLSKPSHLASNQLSSLFRWPPIRFSGRYFSELSASAIALAPMNVRELGSGFFDKQPNQEGTETDELANGVTSPAAHQ